MSSRVVIVARDLKALQEDFSQDRPLRNDSSIMSSRVVIVARDLKALQEISRKIDHFEMTVVKIFCKIEYFEMTALSHIEPTRRNIH